MKVKITDVRGRFLKLLEAKAVGDSSTLYHSGAFAVEPGSDNDKKLQAAMEAVAKEKWNTKGPAILKTLREKGDVAYKLAPLKNAEGEVYGGFEDMYSLNASSNAEKKPAPALWDNDRAPLNETALKVAEQAVKDGKLPPEKAVLRKNAAARLYDGAHYDVVVDIWAQDNSNGKRMNAQLLGVQFRRDGDAFTGGAVADADDFEDLAVGGDDSADDLLGAGE